MSLQTEVKKARELHISLENFTLADKMGVFRKGELLKNLKENKLFKKAIGDGVDTWVDYLKQPEIGLSVSEANRFMQLYEVFMENYGFTSEELSGVPIKALHYLLPKIKAEDWDYEKVEELLRIAQHTSLKDFKEQFFDTVTEEKGERTYTYLVMKKCNETGTMEKVHTVSNDQIISAFQL